MRVTIRRFVSILTFSLLLFLSCSSKPTPVYEDNAAVDMSGDPEIQKIENPDTLMFAKGGMVLTVKLKAQYKIRGILLSRKNYGSGWNAIVSPCDLALAWGNLVKDDLYKQLRWSQGNRWYFWRYGSDFNYDNTFVARYSSNNHIVPATDNLGLAMTSLRNGDIVELTGYLVDIDAAKGDNNYWWNSSTSFNDTGDGSCEVLYVITLKTHGKVYQ